MVARSRSLPPVQPEFESRFPKNPSFSNIFIFSFYHPPLSGIGGLFLCLFLLASELLHPSRLGEEPCLGVQTSGATKRIRALPSSMSVQDEMERGLEKEVVKQLHEENMRRIPARTTKASQRRGKVSARQLDCTQVPIYQESHVWKLVDQQNNVWD